MKVSHTVQMYYFLIGVSCHFIISNLKFQQINFKHKYCVLRFQEMADCIYVYFPEG